MTEEILKRDYIKIKKEIEEKLKNFKGKSKNKILYELIFCLLTPQSKAEICWNCVEKIKKFNWIKNPKKIKNYLKGVRFKNKKTEYIIEAIKKFKELEKKIEEEKDILKLRDYLVKNIKGMGYKEASHFLRNIGKGENLVILDRHILKSLMELKIIEGIPKNISRKKYLEIEGKMRSFSKKIKIPVSHLDFLFWWEKTGKIFK